MTFAFSPAGCCCCGILDDNFDRDDSTDVGEKWIEEAGDPSIVSNRLSFTSTSARLIAAEDAPQMAISITVNVKGGTNANKARVIVDYLDADNFKFAEVIFSTAGAGSMKIWKRVAGVDTQLATTGIALNISGAVFLEWRVCISLTGGIYAQIDSNFANAPFAAVTELKFGLGTGGTVSGSILFDDFSALIVSEECDTCTAGCGICIGGGPAEWLVTIPAGFWTAVDCTTGQCEEAEGDFVLVYGSVFVGDGCEWQYEFSGSSCWDFLYLRIATIPATGVRTAFITLNALNGHRIEWRVPLAASGQADCFNDYQPWTAVWCKQTWTTSPFVFKACLWDGDNVNTPVGNPCSGSREPLLLTAL